MRAHRQGFAVSVRGDRRDRARRRAAFDEVVVPLLLADEDRRQRAREGLRRHMEACRREREASAPVQQAEHDAKLAWLLSQSTRTRAEPGGHDAVCARIDAGIQRAKYGDGPVFPPEWDALRPKNMSLAWPDEEVANAK